MNKNWPYKIKAVIFDNDGTLMDTEWAHTWVVEEISGQKMTWELKSQLMGKNAMESSTIICDHFSLNETPKEFCDRRTQLLEKCWENVELLPGAESIICSFFKAGIRMAIATCSRRMVFNQKIRNFSSLMSMIDHSVCGDDVLKGKPCPDIFLVAQSKWKNILPQETLVFEDSPLGIKAANLAGMASVYIPDAKIDPIKSVENENACPQYTLKSLLEFDMNMFDWGV